MLKQTHTCIKIHVYFLSILDFVKNSFQKFEYSKWLRVMGQLI